VIKQAMYLRIRTNSRALDVTSVARLGPRCLLFIIIYIRSQKLACLIAFAACRCSLVKSRHSTIANSCNRPLLFLNSFLCLWLQLQTD